MYQNLKQPEKRQREVLYLPVVGHSVVLGTAGSGKTTLAIYRAIYLSDKHLSHSGRTLLLTYNKLLVKYLNFLTPVSLNQVQIENYHTFARGYLSSRGKMPNNCICSSDNEREFFIYKAIKFTQNKYPPNKFFNRPIEFFKDEIKWMLCNGITSLEEYLKVERKGRIGTKLSLKIRPIMFEILKNYLKYREESGKLYDWDDLAIHVRKEFQQDSSNRIYKHIIMDEGQDFSPEMIRSLSVAIPSDGSLTFFGDVTQQIYGGRMSWRSAGLQIPKIWRFEENYRNKKEIAKLGVAISKMPYFDGEDLVEPTLSNAAGSPPTIVKCSDEKSQIEKAIEVAQNYSDTQSVVVLCKNHEQENRIKSKLNGNFTQLDRNLIKWEEKPGIYVGTYHSSKGLEFDTVILPFLDSNNLPDQKHIVSQGEEDALIHFGKLLYVAVTRAKTNLLLLYSDELTKLLPINNNLYREIPVHGTNPKGM